MVHFLAAQVCVWRGDLDEAALLVEEGRGIAGQHGFGLWHAALGGVACGIQLARDDAAGAVRDLREALAEFRRLRVGSSFPGCSSAWPRPRCSSVSLPRVSRPSTRASSWCERRWRACKRRSSGESEESCWRPGGRRRTLVEPCFQRALEIARSQGALAFELRAATALARQYAAQGRTADARATLAPRYEAFTEGLDTTDLRAARALLRALDA